MGHEVVALSGKADDAESKAFLTKIGAADVKARSDLEADPKPLAAEVYAGCVDTVGGKVLANAISMAKYGSTVAACGLAGGMGLGTTVAPFILRGVQVGRETCAHMWTIKKRNFPVGRHRICVLRGGQAERRLGQIHSDLDGQRKDGARVRCRSRPQPGGGPRGGGEYAQGKHSRQICRLAEGKKLTNP